MNQAVKPCVLVVEDDGLTRTFLRHALATAGLEIVEATSGEEALAHLQGGSAFEICLIDGMLPDMHGSALAARLLDSASGGQLPLLFVTGALRRPVAPSAGVGALVKPFKVAELLTLVGELRAWREAGGSPQAERREMLAQLEASFLVGP